MISFYNFQIFSLIIVLFLLLSTFYHCLEYYTKEEINKSKVYLYFLRLLAIFIIIFFYFQPNFRYENQNTNSSDLNIYIDASKSMINNVSQNQINQLLMDIKDWLNKNNTKSNFFAVGNEIKSIVKTNDFVFNEDITNMDNFRNHIINSSEKSFLFITDGLRPFGKEQKYNFNKKINIIGVGQNNIKIPHFKNASLKTKKNQTFINFILSETNPATKQIELYQNNSKLCLLSDFMDEELSNSNKVNITSLGLDSFEKLRLIIKDDKNTTIDQINVKYNSFIDKERSLYYFSGGLSYNSKYFLELLNKLPFDSIYFDYNINNVDKNFFQNQVFEADMIFLDNFFQKETDKNIFESIILEAGEKSIPIFIAFGKSHNYDSLKEISSMLQFKVQNIDTERRIDQKILSERYNISNGYYFNDLADYKIDCSQNDNNIKFDDGSYFLCNNKNLFLIFFPEIAKFSYKSIEFGSKKKFDNMIMDIISDAYYDSDKVYIYSKKNKYYNNEKIEIEFSSNSPDGISGAEFYVTSQNREFRIPLDKKFTIPYIGKHKIKLLDNYGNDLSNTLELVVEDFNSEESLIGQNYEFLLNISKSSRGIYSDISQLETDDFLSDINSKTNNETLSKSWIDINSRNYLYYLILGAILLSTEWFLRKRLGLM